MWNARVAEGLTLVELGVREQLDKVSSIPWLDMVALEMP